MLGLKQVYPGATCRKPPQADPRRGVTFSHCVPTILHMLLVHPLSKVIDLSRWKLIIGGSALSQAQARRRWRGASTCSPATACPETCPILPALAQLPTAALADGARRPGRPARQNRHPAAAGGPRVVDDQLAQQPRDGRSVGEVVVRSPWLTQGYLHDPAASEACGRTACCTPATSATWMAPAGCRSPTA